MNARLAAVTQWWPWRRGAREDTGPLPVRDNIEIGGSRPVRLSAFDQPLVAVVGVLVLLGVVMVYSATIALPDSPRFANYTPTFFLQRHLISLMMAMSLGAVATQIPMASWERLARPLFIF